MFDVSLWCVVPWWMLFILAFLAIRGIWGAAERDEAKCK